jgi:3-dehydroquinate synthase
MKTSTKSSIFTGTNSLNDLKQFISSGKYSDVAILVDENTYKHCYPLLGMPATQKVIKVMSGEENKTVDSCLEVWNKLSEMSFDRKSLLIVLGGGLICDMGGFIAATYLRGIDFIFVPTTLLAMCDSSLGGKTSVNFKGFKNQIGVFKNPAAIFIYVDFLKTLNEKQFLSGYAEIIKHALIADKKMFEELNKYKDIKEQIEGLISRSHKIKSKIVYFDFKEQGMRKCLNFGHTIGHGLETFFLKNKSKETLYHGEAVAVGMIAAAWISFKRNLLGKDELDMISSYILRMFPKLIISRRDIHLIIEYCKKDKKNEYNQKMFVLLTGVGQCSINNAVTDEEIVHSLEYYQSL